MISFTNTYTLYMECFLSLCVVHSSLLDGSVAGNLDT